MLSFQTSHAWNWQVVQGRRNHALAKASVLGNDTAVWCLIDHQGSQRGWIARSIVLVSVISDELNLILKKRWGGRQTGQAESGVVGGKVHGRQVTHPVLPRQGSDGSSS